MPSCGRSTCLIALGWDASARALSPEAFDAYSRGKTLFYSTGGLPCRAE